MRKGLWPIAVMEMPTPAALASRRNILIGSASALATVLIWAGWVVATRHAAQRLDVSVVGLLRFGIPALLLAPVWWRTGLWPRGMSRRVLIAIVAGSGVPFFLIVTLGLRFAPAAEVGPLLPGTMPLFVAVMAYGLDRERPSLLRKAGFVLIAIGIAVIVGHEIALGAGATGPGHLLVLTGALLWAIYTIAFRRSGLSAVEGAAVIAAWSTILVLPFGVLPLIEALAHGRGGEVAVQALVQGGLSGVVAVVLFGVAILRLGASRAAAFAALIPALVAMLAIVFLGEVPSGAALMGIAATSAGVALASGAFERRSQAA